MAGSIGCDIEKTCDCGLENNGRAIVSAYPIKQILPESLRHRHTQAVGRHSGRSRVAAYLAGVISPFRAAAQALARLGRAGIM
ncbi:hypothetical protein N9C16_00495 [Paracoccaceae bacterium]|nr:hypothetical protein [Paracoccaceae bacterium]